MAVFTLDTGSTSGALNLLVRAKSEAEPESESSVAIVSSVVSLGFYS